jgi:hypothetical protein
MEVRINKDHVVSIIIVRKKVNDSWTYRKGYKYLFFFKVRAGYYKKSVFGDVCGPFSKEEILEKFDNIYAEGKHVYDDPYITLRLSNGHKRIYSFTTEEEMCQFITDNGLDHLNWIKRGPWLL